MYDVNMMRTRFLMTEDMFHVRFSQDLESAEYMYIYRLILYEIMGWTLNVPVMVKFTTILS